MTNMRSQTFGVEIEMNNIRRDKAAEVAARFFETYRYEYTADRNGYYSWSAYDTQGREWKFQRDSSIAGPDAEKCEMVTPILNYNDIEMLQELVRQLRHAGAKSDSTRGCGVHIHIGSDGQDATSLRHLTNMMYRYEDLITKALWIGRNRINAYCRPVDTRFIQELNEKKPTTMDELADVWYTSQHATCGRANHYNLSRYHMLNLHATFTKGTIEFRLFQFDKPGRTYRGGLHAGKLKSYIQFCLAMCDMAKNMEDSKAEKVDLSNPKYEMDRWLREMKLNSDEFDTLRLVFLEHLDGDITMRNIA